MPKFFTPFVRPESYGETHLDEGKVETAGYRTTEQLVNQLMAAGQNLQIFREAEYADGEVVPEDATSVRPMSRLDALQAQKVLRDSVGARLAAESKAKAVGSAVNVDGSSGGGSESGKEEVKGGKDGNS